MTAAGKVNRTLILDGTFDLEAEVEFAMAPGPNVSATARVVSLRPEYTMTPWVEGLDQRLLGDLAELIRPGVEEVANPILALGIPIPITDGVELIRPSLALHHRTMEINADLQYKDF